jgi:hypothetical protein
MAKISRSIDKIYTEEMEKHAAEDEVGECPVPLSVLVRIMRDVSLRKVDRICHVKKGGLTVRLIYS